MIGQTIPDLDVPTRVKLIRASITGLHNLACQEFWKQEAVDVLIIDKIVREAIDPTYVEEFKDDYVGYSGQMIKMIVQHLQDKWCIVTTLKKASRPDLLCPMGPCKPHHEVCL